MSNVPIRAYIRGGGGGGEGGGDEEIKQLAGGIFSVPPPRLCCSLLPCTQGRGQLALAGGKSQPGVGYVVSDRSQIPSCV